MKKHFILYLIIIMLQSKSFAQSTKSNVRDWKPFDTSSYAGSYFIHQDELFDQSSDEIKFSYVNGTFVASYTNGDITSDIPGQNLIIKGNTFSFVILNEGKQEAYNGKFVFYNVKDNWGDGKIDVYNDEKGILIDNATYYLKPEKTTLTASSVLTEKNKDADFYKAYNLIDKNYGTAWVEGVAGSGIGENVIFKFENPFQPGEISIVNGYAKNQAIYLKNSRPKQIKLTYSDLTTQMITLLDVVTIQKFKPNIKNKITWVKVEIADVYKGTHYEDTCITEIGFY